MSSQIFLTDKSKPLTQPPRVPRPKVTLSSEARKILLHGRHEQSEKFNKELSDAWQKMNEATLNIASHHHKSARRVWNELYLGYAKFCGRCKKPNVWNAFCWKKRHVAKVTNENNPNGLVASKRDVLPDLVKSSKEEYARLSADEKIRLVEEFNKFRESRTKGTHASARSKVNDATHTLSTIENELRSLQCRTGVETILYATRGSTDLPLRGVAFAIEGVQNFIGSVIGIDAHDLVSKMEGFAIQGIKGSAKNHQERVSQVRTEIRHIINRKLRETTDEPNATMQWSQYFRNVVFRYKVIIEAWPPSIPFTNLSKALSALGQLEMLLRKWEAGTTYWRKVPDGELESLQRERDHQLNSGEIEETLRRTRSDKGTKRKRRAERDPDTSCQQKKHKNAEVICTSDDEPANTSANRGASSGGTGSSVDPVPGTSANVGTNDASGQNNPAPDTGSSVSAINVSDASGQNNPTPSTRLSASIGITNVSATSGDITQDQSTGDFDLADLEDGISAFDGASASLF